MNKTLSEIPRLAPPGAGIPALERIIGSAIFAIRRRWGDRDKFLSQFAREREDIAALYRDQDEQILGERVLIPRLRGLEDSSRYWSVYMTLDHLRIVNEQIASVIDALTVGRLPAGRASTAAVKPSADAAAAVVAGYEAACDHLVATVAAKQDLRTSLRYAHPWFGPLDAAGWLLMAATHMGIHRAQVACILAARRAT